MSNLNITIENKAGTYKSFYTEGDPVWDKYPLKGVTYPVDYGCIEGYTGEDEAELDIFVGSGNLSGYIKVWRLDVAEETKILKSLSQVELDAVLKEFKLVLLSHHIFNNENELFAYIEKFKNK